MMERRRRLVFWSAMLILAVTFFMKGRGPSQKEGPAAFFHDDVSNVTIRICGNAANPGIYKFGRGADIETVIKMTLAGAGSESVADGLRKTVLHDGDVLELRRRDAYHIDIAVKKMRAREMVVLGLPLDPNRMDADDWDCLPGIGPVLASAIVRDRQINGDFKSFMDLQRVPGIGETKIEQLAAYF